ncbi:high-potential iron-sulfur protein [Paraglaciecola marina]|uniref:high-potential iron-sulfur protein n=1 Tax=Paraglaciecola marina TaxID=2500157 RepID=UPI00105F9D3E|nr:high-potential iron-sulfur protein [Paraglaciecola marina]
MSKLNRRDFMKLSGSALIGVTLGGVALHANAQERVTLDNPTAAALKYVHISEIEGKNCENCQYLQGEAGSEWRPCTFFPNKLVSSKGWCAGWLKKQG